MLRIYGAFGKRLSCLAKTIGHRHPGVLFGRLQFVPTRGVLGRGCGGSFSSRVHVSMLTIVVRCQILSRQLLEWHGMSKGHKFDKASSSLDVYRTARLILPVQASMTRVDYEATFSPVLKRIWSGAASGVHVTSFDPATVEQWDVAKSE